MVGGMRRLGDIDHFLRGVDVMSWAGCWSWRCGLGLRGAVADLEFPIAGSW